MSPISQFTSWNEPDLQQVLVLGSFLYFLNISGWLCDKLLHAPLIGQIIVGVVYGAPLGNLLDAEWQATFVSVGYIGLILIVFHGGLCTDLDLLVKNLLLGTICAVIGIVTPIVLSLLFLTKVADQSLLSSFAAGAALSSTSLGTTFSVIDSYIDRLDLFRTRVGTVLVAAAVLDDVVGLVLAKVIQVLGPEVQDLWWVILRPILASFGVCAIACLLSYVMRPSYRRAFNWLSTSKSVQAFLGHGTIGIDFLFLISMMALMLTAAHYLGTSILFGSYLAGCSLNFIHPRFREVYGLIEDIEHRILEPLFFGSIGSAIPFLSLWEKPIILKGLVYSFIMCLAKLVVALGLVASAINTKSKVKRQLKYDAKARKVGDEVVIPQAVGGVNMSIELSGDAGSKYRTSDRRLTAESEAQMMDGKESISGSFGDYKDHNPNEFFDAAPKTQPRVDFQDAQPEMPRIHDCWMPASILGVCMVARGEIGLLVIELGFHNGEGIVDRDTFLLTIWAILVCTIIGPVAAGILIKHAEGRLGNWGIPILLEYVESHSSSPALLIQEEDAPKVVASPSLAFEIGGLPKASRDGSTAGLLARLSSRFSSYRRSDLQPSSSNHNVSTTNSAYP